MMNLYLRKIAILSFTLLFSTQIAAQTSGSTGGNTIPTGSTGTISTPPATVADSSIVSNINDKLAHDTSLAGASISVSSKDGFVILDGTALSQEQADLAVADAKTVAGVKDVKSVIKVQ